MGDVLPGRVLVVDDDTAVRTVVARVIGRAGYEVEQASDAAEALARLAVDDFDLLLTDHKMPGMTGAELAGIACADDPSLRVVVITGTDAATVLDALGDTPHQGVLLKPVRPQDIVEMVTAAFSVEG